MGSRARRRSTVSSGDIAKDLLRLPVPKMQKAARPSASAPDLLKQTRFARENKQKPVIKSFADLRSKHAKKVPSPIIHAAPPSSPLPSPVTRKGAPLELAAESPAAQPTTTPPPAPSAPPPAPAALPPAVLVETQPLPRPWTTGIVKPSASEALLVQRPSPPGTAQASAHFSETLMPTFEPPQRSTPLHLPNAPLPPRPSTGLSSTQSGPKHGWLHSPDPNGQRQIRAYHVGLAIRGSWAVRIENCRLNTGFMFIGVCNLTGTCAWGLHPYSGMLYRVSRLEGGAFSFDAPPPDGYPDGTRARVMVNAAGQLTNLQGRVRGAVIETIVDEQHGALSFRINGGPIVEALRGFPPGAPLREWPTFLTKGTRLCRLKDRGRPSSACVLCVLVRTDDL